MSKPLFDYAIIGAGAAGMHLAIQLEADPTFANKRVLVLEKDEKNTNDRTWSFWEKGNSAWDDIAIKKWSKAIFYSEKNRSEIVLEDYYYKTIRSSQFYEYAKAKINNSSRFEWVQDDVVEVSKGTITGQNETYHVGHIFDSRINEAFFQKQKKYVSLTQHFWGWFIETPEPAFDESEFTIMDYRIKWKNQTSFNYVLPFTSSFALVEFTLFNDYLLKEEEYESVLQEYVNKNLGITNFKIVEKEIGQIPMSNYPFHQHHESYLTKIGTAGGWVRPSSGYSFKNGERYAKMIIENLKKGRTPHSGIGSNRYRFYDKIFLGVLKERNELGEEIFETLYTKQPIQSLFRFLDESSSFVEDVKIMSSLNKPIFRKTFLNSFRRI